MPERTVPESDKKERRERIRGICWKTSWESFWLSVLLERVGKNLRLVFTSASSGSWVDLLEMEGKNSHLLKMHLEDGRKASHRWCALVPGSSRVVAGVVCVWLPWFLLGRLVLRGGADVEPRGAAR